MTRLIISAQKRKAPFDIPSGYLYSIDMEGLKILQKTTGIEPPYRQFDINPRGGMRGMRGVSLFSDQMAVANYSAVFLFDRKWNLVRTITHPSVSGIHEIFYSLDGIWVTSTVNDLLVRFGLDGNLSEFDYIRTHENLMSRLRGPSRQILDQTAIRQGKIDFRHRSHFKTDHFDRTHLNGIDILPDGTVVISLGLIVGDLFAFLDGLKTLLIRLRIWKTLLSFNRLLRNIFRLEKHMLSELVVQPAGGRSALLCGRPTDAWRTHVQLQVAHNPSHSPRFLEDGTGLYLDSSHGKLVHFDRQGDILSNPVITEKFLRGLLILPNGQLAIGAGNTLLIYDLMRKEVSAELTLTEDVNISVFDIKILPDSFDIPPESLESKFGRIKGFDGSRIVWDK